MANLEKQSVREEFDRLKTEFKTIASTKKIPPELNTVINSLFVLIELILSIFMEKKTKKTSRNSSKPSSQTEKDETSLSSSDSKKKGRAEHDELANNTRTVETTTLLSVNTCPQCGNSLVKVACRCLERRTKIDIIFEKQVEHYDAEVKDCPNCHAETKGKFPNGVKSKLQYGNGIKAFVIQLLVLQMISLHRAQKLINAMIGCLISEATFLKYILLLYFALETWEQSARAELLKSASMHADETSLRVDKKNQWIHVYSSGDITLKFLHKKRGSEAVEQIGIVPKYGGNLIHDCWASYLSYKHCGHGLCGSHLLRELTFVIDSNGYKWAKNLKKLLQATCKKVSKSKRKKLTNNDYIKLQKHYRNIITRGKNEMPVIVKKSSGKRGKIAKSDAHNLLERFDKHEQAVLLFAREAEVAFTNNRAERDLRMSKVKQKVSGCFRTEKFAKAYCRISSYLQTMNNKGINPLIAVQMALNGNIEL